MRRIFTENLNPVNPTDPASSVRVLESYIRYMMERIEFALTALAGNGADTSLAEIAGELKETSGEIDTLNERLENIEQAVADLQTTVGDISTVLSQI